MSAAWAENEVASKVIAASPVPSNLNFIVRLPSVRRGLLAANRVPLAPRPDHALTGYNRTRHAGSLHWADRGLEALLNGFAQRTMCLDFVDNLAKPQCMSGITSTESNESLDVVIHSKERMNASKRSARYRRQRKSQFTAVLQTGHKFAAPLDKAKAPGRGPGLQYSSGLSDEGSEPGEDRPCELVVQTGADDVLLERDIVHDRSNAGVEAAEIDVEIFSLASNCP